MRVLKVIMTTAPESWSSSEGTPRASTCPAVRSRGRTWRRWKPRRRPSQWGDWTMTPMTGEKPVASTAPKMPIPQGKMKNQSMTTLARLPLRVAAMASWGAPSLRTKQTSTSLHKNAGANSSSTRR